MAETITGITSAILSAAAFIHDALLTKRELVTQEIEGNIVPLNDRFLEIHHGYVRMFNLLVNEIRTIKRQALTNEIDADSVNDRMKKAMNEFVTARRDIDGIRDTFRNEIAALVGVCNSEDVQRYLVSLVAYAVRQDDEIGAKEDQHITRLVDSLTRRGGDGIDTPSMALLKKIENERDPSSALAIIDNALAGLTLKESSVLNSYFHIRVRHI